MTGSYWDPLADVLPADVIAAMSRATLDAIHRGTGRPGEPDVLAGVRALIAHTAPRSEIDAVNDMWLQRHRDAVTPTRTGRRWPVSAPWPVPTARRCRWRT
jgi:hypothetical protein